MARTVGEHESRNNCETLVAWMKGRRGMKAWRRISRITRCECMPDGGEGDRKCKARCAPRTHSLRAPYASRARARTQEAHGLPAGGLSWAACIACMLSARRARNNVHTGHATEGRPTLRRSGAPPRMPLLRYLASHSQCSKFASSQIVKCEL